MTTRREFLVQAAGATIAAASGRAIGVTKQQLRTITVDNPPRFFGGLQ